MTPSGPDMPRIGGPATSALAAVGVTRLEQVAAMREADVLALHGMGPKAIRLLRAAMAEGGLAFHDDDGGRGSSGGGGSSG
jgi:predicted flap endonuclease-1-like 5' DNA nuclease